MNTAKPLNMGLASSRYLSRCRRTHRRQEAPQALINLKDLAQAGRAPRGPGTVVVLLPLLGTALRPFRSRPLCAHDSGGGHGEGTRDALVAFPPVSPDPAALRTIIYGDPLARRDLDARDAYRTLQSAVLCVLHMLPGDGLDPMRPRT